MACHPWRPPCRPLRSNVKNGSRPFFIGSKKTGLGRFFFVQRNQSSSAAISAS